MTSVTRNGPYYSERYTIEANSRPQGASPGYNLRYLTILFWWCFIQALPWRDRAGASKTAVTIIKWWSKLLERIEMIIRTAVRIHPEDDSLIIAIIFIYVFLDSVERSHPRGPVYSTKFYLVQISLYKTYFARKIYIGNAKWCRFLEDDLEQSKNISYI